MDLEAIRNQSLAYLRRFELPEDHHLPFLDDVQMVRDVESRIVRLLCMHAAAAVAYGFPRESVVKWIEAEDVREGFSHSESEFIYDKVGEVGEFQTQVEAMWAIAWTLGIVKALDFRKNAEESFVRLLPNLKEMESAKNLSDAVKERPLAEVVAAADLAYCLHCGMTQTALQGKISHWPVETYVIINRRKAFDWVIGDEIWSEVTLDT